MKTKKPTPSTDQVSSVEAPPVLPPQEMNVPIATSGPAQPVFTHKQNVQFTVAVGVIILGITFLMLAIEHLSIRSGGVVEQMPQQTQEITKNIPKEDWSKLPGNEEIVSRLQALYNSTEQHTASNGVGDARGDDFQITSWDIPHSSSKLTVGEKYKATGEYRIPADYLGRISVFRNGVLIGAQVIDNRGKEAGNGAFEISLPPYVAGPSSYTLEYDGAASCRLVCAPTDTACSAKETTYCAVSHTNEMFKNYEPVVVGMTDLYTEKTCLTKTFTSGPKNQSAPDSCGSEGFQNPFHIEAAAFVNGFDVTAASKSSFTQDLAAFYRAVTTGGGEKSIQRDMGEVSWSFDYKQSSESQNGMCMGMTVVKVHCPKE